MSTARGRAWTADEDAILIAHYASSGADIPELSKRSAHSIRKRARKLGIVKDVNSWTAEEERILRESYETCGVDIPEIKRTLGAIHKKAVELGLKKCVKNKWTADEVAILKDAYSRGDIPVFDRHPLASVQAKARSLGLVESNRWSELELSILRDNYFEQGPAGVAKLIPNRTYNQIVSKAQKLGLSVDSYFRCRSLDVAKVKSAFDDFVYCTCAVCGEVFLVRGEDYKTFSHSMHDVSVPVGWVL